MNAQDVISRVDRIKPNAFTDEDKLQWIDSLEGMIQAEIYLLRPAEIVRVATLESVLSAPFPYDALYDLYLQAMIDFHNGEYDRYNSTYEMFNSKWEDFCAWYTTHYPTYGDIRFGCTMVSTPVLDNGEKENPDGGGDENTMMTVILKQDGYDEVLQSFVQPTADAAYTFTASGATFDEVVAEIKAGKPVAAYVQHMIEGFFIMPVNVIYLPAGSFRRYDALILTFGSSFYCYWYNGTISNTVPDNDFEEDGE